MRTHVERMLGKVVSLDTAKGVCTAEVIQGHHLIILSLQNALCGDMKMDKHDGDLYYTPDDLAHGFIAAEARIGSPVAVDVVLGKEDVVRWNVGNGTAFCEFVIRNS